MISDIQLPSAFPPPCPVHYHCDSLMAKSHCKINKFDETSLKFGFGFPLSLRPPNDQKSAENQQKLEAKSSNICQFWRLGRSWELLGGALEPQGSPDQKMSGKCCFVGHPWGTPWSHFCGHFPTNLRFCTCFLLTCFCEGFWNLPWEVQCGSRSINSISE